MKQVTLDAANSINAIRTIIFRRTSKANRKVIKLLQAEINDITEMSDEEKEVYQAVIDYWKSVEENGTYH